MIEAGAEEIPEDEILEAFEIAHAEIVKICDAQEDPGVRPQAQVPRPELTAELESQHGPDPRADRRRGLSVRRRAPSRRSRPSSHPS